MLLHTWFFMLIKKMKMTKKKMEKIAKTDQNFEELYISAVSISSKYFIILRYIFFLDNSYEHRKKRTSQIETQVVCQRRRIIRSNRAQTSNHKMIGLQKNNKTKLFFFLSDLSMSASCFIKHSKHSTIKLNFLFNFFRFLGGKKYIYISV